MFSQTVTDPRLRKLFVFRPIVPRLIFHSDRGDQRVGVNRRGQDGGKHIEKEVFLNQTMNPPRTESNNRGIP